MAFYISRSPGHSRKMHFIILLPVRISTIFGRENGWNITMVCTKKWWALNNFSRYRFRCADRWRKWLNAMRWFMYRQWLLWALWPEWHEILYDTLNDLPMYAFRSIWPRMAWPDLNRPDLTWPDLTLPYLTTRSPNWNVFFRFAAGFFRQIPRGTSFMRLLVKNGLGFIR